MTDPKFLEANAAKLAKMAMDWSIQPMAPEKPDTDWHAKAQMYSECLGRVKDFCNIHHLLYPECLCAECTIKRRVLNIINTHLK